MKNLYQTVDIRKKYLYNDIVIKISLQKGNQI